MTKKQNKKKIWVWASSLIIPSSPTLLALIFWHLSTINGKIVSVSIALPNCEFLDSPFLSVLGLFLNPNSSLFFLPFAIRKEFLTFLIDWFLQSLSSSSGSDNLAFWLSLWQFVLTFTSLVSFHTPARFGVWIQIAHFVSFFLFLINACQVLIFFYNWVLKSSSAIYNSPGF